MSYQPGTVCPRCFGQLAGNRYCHYCGHDSFSHPQIKSTPLPPFTRIGGRYLLGTVLGAGGFGVTYAALDTATGSRIAVKEYYPLDLSVRDTASGQLYSSKNPAEFETGLNRFAEEAEALRALSRSPYIVYFTDLVRENGTAYLVMEFIEGKNLRDFANEYGGRVPFQIAYSCLTSIALALADVHTRGILHRDISPENILLQADGECKLIDFGAARTGFSPLPKSGTVFLKPGYAPPEQYHADGNQGPWTDVYALACTFYRLVTGLAVPDAMERTKGVPVPAIHTLVSDVPLHVSFAIEKAMNLRVEDRFPNMHAFIGEIIAYNDDHSTRKSTTVGKNSGSRFLDFFYELGNKQKNPEVIIVGGPYTGAGITLTDGIPLLIGRLSPTCGLIAGSDPRISRIHCKLTYYKSAGYVVLEDTSSNGTYLPESGYRMHKGETLRLEYTTLLQLATSDSMIKVVMK